MRKLVTFEILHNLFDVLNGSVQLEPNIKKFYDLTPLMLSRKKSGEK